MRGALDLTVGEQVTGTIEPRIGMESPSTSGYSRLIDSTLDARQRKII
jgi:hypothetical protein